MMWSIELQHGRTWLAVVWQISSYERAMERMSALAKRFPHRVYRVREVA